MIGHVTRWDQAGMFGFIRADHLDYFVHIAAIDNRQPLDGGQLVEFQPAAAPRGPRATAVRRVAEECGKCGALLSRR